MKRKLLAILCVLCVCVLAACDFESQTGVSNEPQRSQTSQQNSTVDGAQSNSLNTNTSIGNLDNSSKSVKNSGNDVGISSDIVNSTIKNSSNNSTNKNSTNSSNNGASSQLTSASNSSGSGSPISPTGGDLSNPTTPINYELTLKNANLTGTSVNSNISAFNCEGYASGVTGGGLLKPGDSGYVQVSTAQEFIKAISRKNYDDSSDKGFPSRPMVIEVMNDIDLGYNVIGAQAQAYSDVVAAKSASVHPTLKNTGVSTIYITARENLTIYSKNGAELQHACFVIRGDSGSSAVNTTSQNIMIRNLKFRGAWEWDDSGKYDANDWDIMTIRSDKGVVKNIWIDHCTFTKPYDGTIDIKYHATNVTISWCAFIPYTKTDGDFMSMMNYLEQNKSSFPNYNAARNGGATFDDMVEYASINKKVHLIGHSDNTAGDEVFAITYCNNYYKNCTERLPRLRMGKAHVYNCIFDASTANAFKNSIVNRRISWPAALTFASNGSLGTNYGKLLLENCYINGINTPLRNNNKKDGEMYVGSVDALYTYYTIENINRDCKYGVKSVVRAGRYTFLGNSTANDGNYMQPFPSIPLAFDTDAFKNSLGYDYILYDPLKLHQVQNGNVGCGKMDFDTSEWEVSSYSSSTTISNTIPSGGVKGSTANKNASRK